MRHVVIQGLRHTHATHLAEAGAPLYGIQQRLGHAISNSTTIGFYIHPTDTVKKITLVDYLIDYMDYLNSKGIY